MEKHTARVGTAIVRYLALTAAAALVVILFRTVVPANQTTVALTFLMMVLLTASRWRLTYSVYLSILCTLLYNFFFLPPVGRLTIADPRNWVALAAFLASSFLVSHLSDKEHRHAESSEGRRQEVERLYEFSQQLLLQEDLRGLARATPSVAAAVFGFRAVALYVRDDDTAYYSDPASELLPVVELKLASHQADAGITLRNGVHIIPLSLGMHSPGTLAVTDGGFSPQIYEAISSLVAIALERAAAVERSSRLEAWREGERLRSALLDSVTHDLRTPLTAIRAAATTLASQADLGEPERADLVAGVEDESARLDRLIGQAVEMAQLDTDGIEVRPKLQRLQEVIDIALEDCHALLRGRPVTVELPPDMPLIPVDRELIRRVLRHLLENAARYSPAGSPVSIGATLEADRLLVSITDQGQGIDDAEQAYIFDKFYRGSRQRMLHGTGMGLAIAKAILRAHGGGIDVVSHRDEGATFTFWVPLDLVTRGPS
jgi:two-component system sensor histidine kinase KdpD